MLHYLYYLVLPNGNDPLSIDYQSIALPLSYGRMVVPVGIEPTSMPLQDTAMTTSAKAPIFLGVTIGIRTRTTRVTV